ncbi:AbrB/MazE/SpoVT family DNA-binding domain-containing protein [Paenibacillus larvae]|uniref:AbrB/MazE/SpoVT family DNA-binding domain-containing protein n=1 Tax=Paenibacillus larvae TaxID=1464 RepID=UPI0028540413|nr:AbrB/MazE/SpoVT family DNA-binding domain-containing protein [Paenibacillus larvae]MDR5582850.1 AbrB/MazE/SpoVT family DNA-binding domain-containing protein [Paenibacillus larvae]
MKVTGIVRKLDELGRVVIPKELRTTLGIGEKDALEIYVDGERIMLKKYNPGCYLCGGISGDLQTFFGRNICQKCIEEISNHADKIKESLSNTAE